MLRRGVHIRRARFEIVPDGVLAPLLPSRLPGHREAIEGEDRADYDVAFIGTAHPKKYGFVQEVVEQCEGLLDRKYIYHFLPSRLLYARHKLLSEDYRRAAYSQFHFDALTPEETEEVVSRSWCMLDSPQDGQRGLTMRTMECLGARRKIITTNEEIMGYDFYRKENVYVYRGRMDRKDPFSSEYVDLPEDIYEKYSLRPGWKPSSDAEAKMKCCVTGADGT